MAKKNKENAPLIENEGVEENVIPTPAPNEEKEETPSEEPAQAKPRGRAKAEAEHEPEVVHEHTPEVVHEHTPESHDEVSNLEIFREYPGVFMPARANANDAGIDFFLPVLTDHYLEKLREDNKDMPTPIIAEGGFPLTDEQASQMTEEQRKEYVENSKHYIILYPNSHIILPLGIRAIVPANKGLFLYNKSGVTTKLGLGLGASVIDEGYRGTIKLHLHNFTNIPAKITFGMKIVQGVLHYLEYEGVTELSAEEFEEKSNTGRGDGGFGSTGA